MFSIDVRLSGQEKLSLSGGIGFPELINCGIRFQIRQTQLEISIGIMPGSSFEGEKYEDNNTVSVSTDIYYHFEGLSRFSERLPWYLRSGFIYCDAAAGNNLLWFNCRAGREINLSGKFGLSIDAGIILELFNEEKRTDPQLYSDTPTFLLPGIGIGVFYRPGHSQE